MNFLILPNRAARDVSVTLSPVYGEWLSLVIKNSRGDTEATLLLAPGQLSSLGLSGFEETKLDTLPTKLDTYPETGHSASMFVID